MKSKSTATISSFLVLILFIHSREHTYSVVEDEFLQEQDYRILTDLYGTSRTDYGQFNKTVLQLHNPSGSTHSSSCVVNCDYMPSGFWIGKSQIERDLEQLTDFATSNDLLRLYKKATENSEKGALKITLNEDLRSLPSIKLMRELN